MSDVCNSCGSAGIVENPSADPRAAQVTTVRPCRYCISPRVTLLCDRCHIHHESVCKVNAARLGRGEGATVRTQPMLRTVPTTPVIKADDEAQASEFTVKFNDSDKLAAELATTDGAEQAPEITEFIPEPTLVVSPAVLVVSTSDGDEPELDPLVELPTSGEDVSEPEPVLNIITDEDVDRIDNSIESQGPSEED